MHLNLKKWARKNALLAQLWWLFWWTLGKYGLDIGMSQSIIIWLCHVEKPPWEKYSVRVGLSSRVMSQLWEIWEVFQGVTLLFYWTPPGHDIKDYEHLSTGQVGWNVHLSRWLTDLPTTSKSVYYTQSHKYMPKNELVHRTSSWQNLLVRIEVLLVPDNKTIINVAHCLFSRSPQPVL